MNLLPTRLFLAGVISLALLVLGYPGKSQTAPAGSAMSCCHEDGKTPSPTHEKPAMPGSQGVPCCPGCALAFAAGIDGAAQLIVSLQGGKTISLESTDALVRTQRPPVPPPRSLAA